MIPLAVAIPLTIFVVATAGVVTCRIADRQTVETLRAACGVREPNPGPGHLGRGIEDQLADLRVAMLCPASYALLDGDEVDGAGNSHGPCPGGCGRWCAATVEMPDGKWGIVPHDRKTARHPSQARGHASACYEVGGKLGECVCGLDDARGVA